MRRMGKDIFVQTSMQKVAERIFKNPTVGLTVRELGRKIGVSHTRVIFVVKNLEKSGLVRIVKERTQKKIFANMEDERFRALKRAYNLYSLAGLAGFLARRTSPDAIAVYGSYSKGEDTEGSDIDIFIPKTMPKDVYLELAKFERTLERKIHVLAEPWKDVPRDLRASILNGIVLYGVLEC